MFYYSWDTGIALFIFRELVVSGLTPVCPNLIKYHILITDRTTLKL
jgi:hypothetical protein